MAGYQTIEALRPILHRGPPAAPLVNRALVRPEPVTVSRQANSAHKPAVIAEIIRLRELGMCQQDVANALGVSRKSVRKYAGHVPMPEGGWTIKNDRRGTFSMEFARRLHRSGFSYTEIAEELGCSRSTAYYLFNPRRVVSRNRASPTARLVQSVVRATGVGYSELRCNKDAPGGRKSLTDAKARHILFWLCRTRLQKSGLIGIGVSLGGYDHSSILYGIRRVEKVVAALGINTARSAQTVARDLWAAEWPKASA